VSVAERLEAFALRAARAEAPTAAERVVRGVLTLASVVYGGLVRARNAGYNSGLLRTGAGMPWSSGTFRSAGREDADGAGPGGLATGAGAVCISAVTGAAGAECAWSRTVVASVGWREAGTGRALAQRLRGAGRRGRTGSQPAG
jgi:hypothetical protein